MGDAPKAKGQVAESIDRSVEAVVTAEDRRDAVIREYSQYVATQPIDVGGARAYNEGDPVPAANVEAHGYLDAGLVRKREP